MTVFLQPGRRALLKTTAAAAAAAAAVGRASVASADAGPAGRTAGRAGQYCSRPGRLLILKLEMRWVQTLRGHHCDASVHASSNSLRLNSDKTNSHFLLVVTHLCQNCDISNERRDYVWTLDMENTKTVTYASLFSVGL